MASHKPRATPTLAKARLAHPRLNAFTATPLFQWKMASHNPGTNFSICVDTNAPRGRGNFANRLPVKTQREYIGLLPCRSQIGG